MDLLTEILAPARPTAIVDVGANPIDGTPPYHAMLAAGLCDVIGFEPQPEALARLEKAKGPRERYLPFVLGDGTERTLNVCELDGMTSLLVPDPAHLALFNLFPIWGQVKARIPVATDDADASGHRLRLREVEPVEGWQAWSEGILDMIRSCESTQALDRVRIRHRQLLYALKRERPDLYANIGQGFAMRSQQLAAPLPKRAAKSGPARKAKPKETVDA